MDQQQNVFLFVPNLIGYARIVFGLISFYYMPTDYWKAAIYYFLSGILDAFDGYAARLLNQSSRFGAMLDQLTDRCATLALVMVLSSFYPEYMFFFQLSAVIDIASHWLHLHSHDLTGSQSHKSVDSNKNPILHLYYTSRPFLFFMCAGNDGFFAFMYLCYFTHGPKLPLLPIGLWQMCAVLCFPVMLVKSAISLIHLVTAAQTVAEVDMRLRQEKAN